MNTKLILFGCLLSLSTLCAEETPAVSLDVREYLAPAWTDAATRIIAGDLVIYYQGEAKRSETTDSATRLTLKGDILVIEKDNVLAASEASFSENGSGKISVKGPSRTVMSSSDPFIQKRVKELNAKR